LEWGLLFISFLIVLFALLFAGQWIAFALGTCSIIGFYVIGSGVAFNSIGNVIWKNTNSLTLTAIPLFIFMGEIILRSGISGKFYNGVTAWIGKLPGGLLHSNIVACAFFAAITGSSVATAAAIGSVAIPEQEKRGYNRKLVYGSIGGGGTLGILIPPSIPFIIYGVLTEQSVARLFMAGIIPGVVLALIFMAFIFIRVKLNKSLAPHYEDKITWSIRFKGLIDMFPLIFLIGIILGGIYLGVMTPTEAAAIGAIFSIGLCLFYRTLNFKMFKTALENTVKTSCMVLFIIVGASFLSYLMVVSGINRELTTWVVAQNFSISGFLILLVVIYFILGCLMDGNAMIFLTMPVLWPIIVQMGINPIWFGVFLVIMIELAQITPPVGLNLFVLHGVVRKTGIKDIGIGYIIMSCLPYFLLLLLMLLIISIFPGLATWLPANM